MKRLPKCLLLAGWVSAISSTSAYSIYGDILPYKKSPNCDEVTITVEIPSPHVIIPTTKPSWSFTYEGYQEALKNAPTYEDRMSLVLQRQTEYKELVAYTTMGNEINHLKNTQK